MDGMQSSVHAIIQARSTSKRLPNKGLIELDGKPVISHVFRAVKSAISNVVIAVPFGDPIAGWCYQNDVMCFQGSEDDCLLRYYKCAKAYKMNYIIRITADCPLLDTAQLHYMAHTTHTKEIDFLTNAPCQDGTDIEVMSFGLLSWLHENVKSVVDREHVTKYVKDNWDVMKKRFKLGRYRSPYLLSWLPKTSIDTQADLDIVSEIYTQLAEQNNEG